MNTPTPTPTPSPTTIPTPTSASGRRLRSALAGTVGLLAIVVCLIFANILSQRFAGRYDVTATGEHRLSPRTESLLGGLSGEYRIVIAGDLAAPGRPTVERVRDVVTQMTRRAGKVSASFLDTSSSTGLAEFESLIAELARRDREVIDLQTRAIRAAADRVVSTANFLDEGLSPTLQKLRDTLGVDASGQKLRQTLDERAAAARLTARDLRSAAGAIEGPLGAKLGATSIPRTDEAGESIRAPLALAAEQIAALSRELRAIAGAAQLPQATRDTAEGLIAPVTQAADGALAATDAMARLSRPDVLRVAGVLQEASACLVVGPPGSGLIAIEFSHLFPPVAGDAGSVADAGRRAEQLISTAMGSLATPVRPIVVFTHAEAVTDLVKRPGIVSRVVRRLSLRGIDSAEWAVAKQAEPPALTSLDPDRSRPVVYVTLSPDSSSPKPTPTELSGAERAAKLGAAITLLADRGEPILLSMNPSVLPTYGEADPTTAVLARFGMNADTARPLLRERLTPRGRVVETDQIVRGVGDGHPIARAIRGLPTYIPWPIHLTADAAASGSPLTPSRDTLLAIESSQDSWAESQWLNYWRIPRSERSAAINQPKFDEARDARPTSTATPATPAAVAYAAEIPGGAGSARRRLVAVGSNSWYMDPVTTPEMTVDGRTFAAHPGNLELFEASVLWLAGQDQLIAQSPEARAVAVIQPLDESTVRIIRAGAILGMPALILLLAVMYRWWRG